MKKVAKGKKNKRNAVFIGFYAKDVKPYIDYTGVPDDEREFKMDYTLMMMRWDGTLGFIGGMVDKGEDFETALIREIQEEVGYRIKSNNLELLCTHEVDDDLNAHFYICNLSSIKELKSVIFKSVLSKHFVSENNGLILVPLKDWKDERPGISNLLKQKFSSSSKKELLLLKKFIND